MTPRPLLLVGSGGLAREVLATVRAANSISERWAVAGFLDDDSARHGRYVDGALVLGPPELVSDYPDSSVLICTASTRDLQSRARIHERLSLPHDRFATVVHPAASLAQGTELGPGSICLAFVAVTAPQVIGQHVVVMPHTTITHDDNVGDYVTFASRVALSGGVRVGLAAYLGSGALVREGLDIGAGAVIGMGAVVLEHVPPGQVWVGNPARYLRRQHRLDSEQSRIA